MTSALPRFSGPAQVRQRMRLAAALGLLAIAALMTGGLASLAASRGGAGPAGSGDGVDAEAGPPAMRSQLPDLIDPASLVEARVDQAEQAVTKARAAIRSARQLGVVDHARLDELERELDAAIGRRTPASTAPSAAATGPSSSRARANSVETQARSL